MQGYSKGSVRPFIPFHYNRSVEASMQSYSKGNMGPSIPVLYND
jgi:hypothetical protein